MAKVSVRQIVDEAVAFVNRHPTGVTVGDIRKHVFDALPDANRNTVLTQISELPTSHPDLIARPSRGVLKPANAAGPTSEELPAAGGGPGESQFYEPFAHWLRETLEEVTVAVTLGGSALRSKWGTPDVVGVYKPLASDRIKFAPEVVSAEIKINPGESIVAFGQAVAYRLFSAKSYVVMPRSISPDDLSRLEALALLVGIGVVLFDPDLEKPGFDATVRAQRLYPDMFYVNEFAERLHNCDRKAFNELFG